MNHYDVIIIGTGAGGGALAQRLAASGKRILILERGTFLPQEKENWDTSAVFIENRYHTDELRQDSEGKLLHPQTASWVGGKTKVSFEADEIRNKKVDVLHAVRPIHADDVRFYVVRGQYGTGRDGLKRVPGYREEPAVAPDSQIAEGLGIRRILHPGYKSTRAKLSAIGLKIQGGGL